MKRIFHALIIAGVFFTFASSCKKPKNTITPPPPGALVLWSNVHVVDSTQWILHNSPADGTYSFTFTPTTPEINVQIGDILIGSTNGGYIRKVTGTSFSGPLYNIITTQATMADVFKSGTFTLQVPINDPSQTSPGVYRSFTNVSLYNQYGYTVNLLNAQFDIQPTLSLTFSFDSTGLTNFQMSTTNTTAKDSLTLAVRGLEPFGWSASKTLSTMSLSSLQWVQAYGNISVPIVMQFNISYIATLAGGSANYGSDSANTLATWVSNAAFSGGAQYTANAWQPIHSDIANSNVALDSAGFNGNINTRAGFVAQVMSQFYGVGGPQIIFGLAGDVKGSSRFAPGYTRRTDICSVATDAQSGPPIFGRSIPGFTQSWASDSVFYQVPYQMLAISGDSDSTTIANVYPIPLTVKVVDSRGNPVNNIAVTFNISNAGSGHFGNGPTGPSSVTIYTDVTGTVQVTWTAGSQQGYWAQSVSATVVDGNQTPINGAPHVFRGTAK